MTDPETRERGLSELRSRLARHPRLDGDDITVLNGVERAAWIAGHYQRVSERRPVESRRSLVAIVPDRTSAIELRDALELMVGGPVRMLEAWDALPFEPCSLEPATAARRIEALAGLVSPDRSRPMLCLATARAVARKVMPRDLLLSLQVRIACVDEIPPRMLRARLVDSGYRMVPEVSEVGEFAARGGIVDVFSPGQEYPVRIEWDGDLVESIRQFDVGTQRSIRSLDAVEILPPREIHLPEAPADREAIASRIEKEITSSLRRDRFLDAIRAREPLEGLEVFLPYFCECVSIFDLGSFECCVVDPDETALRIGEIFEEAGRESEISDIGFAAEHLWLASLPEVDSARTARSLPRDGSLAFGSEALPDAPLDSSLLRVDVRRLVDRGDQVVVVSSLGKRVAELLRERGVPESDYLLLEGTMGSGARLPEIGVSLVSDVNLFGVRRRGRGKGRKKKLLSWGALSPGDYVVHVHHGVGIFRGVERINSLGETRDVILVEYAGQDRLYLPPHETELLERYVVAEGRPVRLDRLGSASWSKLREKVERETAELARELLDLYALRSVSTASPYAPRDEETDFADSFGYEETPDQKRSMEEILEDLYSDGSEIGHGQRMPMDRLLCGDVGFGKTEVAMRAAFRVVGYGRQVAVLCPTTVLSLQHTRTFHDRMHPFGIRVANLSRLQSAKEAKIVLEDLAAGKIGVIVGTHALLGKSVRFRDLGLLVVDEEQRFGVRHKEHIKTMRKQVDVLTMTATPIPRTLHLALSGVRSISTIETPPPGRSPVQTVVEPFNDDHIVKAIRRELDRDGQIFYVHNRIETLDRIHEFLRDRFPKAKIGIGHGQMNERDLAAVMERFLGGEIQILLSTSIVENGLDVPRANTMIVDMAELFGLAELYQLRGRVGRSKIRAYAYFFYSSDRPLSATARSRLAAIAEHTALGSGYAIARRDMELRGAGEILGASQHGEMEGVGYDMYCRLLREALDELRGSGTKKETRPVVDLAVTAYIPEEWLGGTELVSEVHREITRAGTIAEIDAVRESLIDRFGQPPEPVENLLEIARIRAYASIDRVESIIDGEHGVTIRWKKAPKDIEAFLGKLPQPLYPVYRAGTAVIENLPSGRRRLEVVRRILRR